MFYPYSLFTAVIAARYSSYRLRASFGASHRSASVVVEGGRPGQLKMWGTAGVREEEYFPRGTPQSLQGSASCALYPPISGQAPVRRRYKVRRCCRGALTVKGSEGSTSSPALDIGGVRASSRALAASRAALSLGLSRSLAHCAVVGVVDRLSFASLSTISARVSGPSSWRSSSSFLVWEKTKKKENEVLVRASAPQMASAHCSACLNGPRANSDRHESESEKTRMRCGGLGRDAAVWVVAKIPALRASASTL